MEKQRFTVIEGGLGRGSAVSGKREFVECQITNTRLMGVLAMHMVFNLPDDDRYPCIHQFFYFDSEEFGFETYKAVKGNDMRRVNEIRNSLMGGLGGELRNISQREAMYILQKYARFNRERGIPFPDGIEEYGFLLNDKIELPPPDRYILEGKICVRPRNAYEVVNYFLMRCFGKDFDGARILADKNLELDIFPDYKAGTFCKNIVDEAAEADTYMSESLVEFDNCYHLTITKIRLQGNYVAGFERVNTLDVSPFEAAMMLSRSEFVNVYDVKGFDTDLINRSTTELSAGSMITEHSGGRLFMIFHPNNNHVAKKEYRLNEDVLGLYYITDSEDGESQIICSSYSRDDILEIERDLARSILEPYVISSGKYEFQEPVVYEFIHSGFRDFNEFVKAISLGEE